MKPRTRRKYTKTPIEQTKSYEYYLLWAKQSLEESEEGEVLSVKQFVRYLKAQHGIKISYQAMYVHLKRLIEDELAWYTKYGVLHLKAVHGKIGDDPQVAQETDRI